jgi:hypothetical protein
LLIKVDLAWSIKRRVFAMQRRASQTASGSSLKVVENPRRVDKLLLVARNDDPVGSLPRVFTVNRALAASVSDLIRKHLRVSSSKNIPFAVNVLLGPYF